MIGMLIQNVKARMVFDSRGNPTVEATVHTKGSVGRAAAASGASTGTHEAVELRDGGKAYFGKGVSKAVKNAWKIEGAVRGIDAREQRKVDSAMIALDGTPNKRKLGANITTAVSMATARAAASGEGKELFEYLNPSSSRLPIPQFNVINGGKHAGSGLAIQEFMVVPHKAGSFGEAMRIGVEVYHTLRKIIEKKYGRQATSVGDEGGFAPPVKSTGDALALIQEAVDGAGYARKVQLAVDCAASEFFNGKEYEIDGKRMGAEGLHGLYLDIVKEYGIFSIEDPFGEDDFESFAALNKATKCRVVGDDLTVSSIERISRALGMGSMDTLLLKVNQVGTLSEAVEAAGLAKNNGCGVIVSHRSGETCDPFIADLAVSLECGIIKTGAPCRSERLAKYNRLLEIECLLGNKASYGLIVA